MTVAETNHEPTTSKIVAHVLTGLLVADVAGAAARLAVPPMLSRGNHPWQLDIDVKPIVILSRVAFAATVVTFLIWFFQARVESEKSGWPQRHARGSVFWGWVIPFAVLWIPYQTMADVWRAHRPPRRRHKIAWLPVVWWTSWLLTGVLSPGHHEGYGLQLAATWWQFFIFAVASSALIAIVQTVAYRRT